jgi:hypothetical protein
MRREGFERFFKNRTRQVRAVAVEGNNAALVAHCEVRKYRRKACRKALTLLCNYVRSVTGQTS